MGYYHFTPMMEQMIAKYPATDAQWMYQFHLPLCWIIVITGPIVLVLFNIFPKNRRFPASIAAWTTMLDVVYYVWELSKWGPYTKYHEELNYVQTNEICKLYYAWIAFIDAGQALCTLFMAYVIYKSIVKKIDMSYNTNPRYYQVMVTSFWIYTILWTILIYTVPKYRPPDGALTFCPFSKASFEWDVAFIVQFLVATLIEMVLLSRALRYAKTVWKLAMSSVRSRENYMARLQIRFFFIVFLQATARINWHILTIILSIQLDSVSQIELLTIGYIHFTMVLSFLCYFTDILILLLTNRPLTDYVRRRLHLISSLLSTATDSMRSDSRKMRLNSTHTITLTTQTVTSNVNGEDECDNGCGDGDEQVRAAHDEAPSEDV